MTEYLSNNRLWAQKRKRPAKKQTPDIMKCSTKNEWVLDGDTVLYGGAAELRETLEYDLAVERDFSYAGLTMQEVIRHLTRFISRLWQIYVFGEGNTRSWCKDNNSSGYQIMVATNKNMKDAEIINVSLALALGLMAGMSLTAYAINGDYVNETITTDPGFITSMIGWGHMSVIKKC